MLYEVITVLLVVGSRNSSNSNRLRDLGERAGVPAYLIDSADDIDPTWLSSDARVGLTRITSYNVCYTKLLR